MSVNISAGEAQTLGVKSFKGSPFVQAWVSQARICMPRSRLTCTRSSRHACMRSSKLPCVIRDCQIQKSVTYCICLLKRCQYSARHGAEGMSKNVAARSSWQGTLLRLDCNFRRWLLGLLVLQSTSSFVLEQYQELLKQHLVVTVFLTMLVGAGGNAGNQSAIKVIRGLVRICLCCIWSMLFLFLAHVEASCLLVPAWFFLPKLQLIIISGCRPPELSKQHGLQ